MDSYLGLGIPHPNFGGLGSGSLLTFDPVPLPSITAFVEVCAAIITEIATPVFKHAGYSDEEAPFADMEENDLR